MFGSSNNEYQPDPFRMMAELQQRDLRINELTETLQKAKAGLIEAKQEIDRLSSPPMAMGVFVQEYGENQALILIKGERFIVTYDSALRIGSGEEVLINEAHNIIGPVTDAIQLGDAKFVTQVLADSRLVISDERDNAQVILAGPDLWDVNSGDRVLVNMKAGVAYEVLPKDEEAVEHLLETVPDLQYSDIGGLSAQIEELRDAVELPFLQKELHAAYKLKTPKGVLLYGPPGGGKTMLAKAVANSLAKQAGHESGYFINIAGPELLSKWVGETERQIREVFELARDKAKSGVPVVVFMDEIESLFPIRGSGVSSDTEKTIVPQILAEIDGVEEGMDNVILIGATNRADLVDPALLRPGRLDIKIRISRPDITGATEILKLYLGDTPIWGNHSVDSLGIYAAQEIFRESNENKFLEVTYVDGKKETLYFHHFISGAMLANIVNRAKRFALKEELKGRERGVTDTDLAMAVQAEFHENEDLPNTTSPDDWAAISGKRGATVAQVRSLVTEEKSRRSTTDVDTTNRQYL